MKQKILIVGIGVMGAPMAKNIINAGFDVAVCDESSDALVDFHDIATLVSTSPSKAASNRNVIITVLPNSDIVENVLLLIFFSCGDSKLNPLSLYSYV